MNKTWWEQIQKYSEKEIGIDVLRGQALAKLTIAYNSLFDNTLATIAIQAAPVESIKIEKLVYNDFMNECFRMMLFNYSVALIGMGKNDKISLYNDKILKNSPKVQEFYKNKKNEIKELEKVRNKIYSHLDPKAFDELSIIISFDFFKDLINFTTDVMGIKNPKIKPK